MRHPWKKLACQVAAMLLLGISLAKGHPSLPDSVLNPRSAAEAWNVLRLATANADQLLRENRLAEITDQVALCSPALRALASLAPTGKETTVAERTVHAATFVTSVAQSSLAGDAATTVRNLAALQADLRELAASFDPAAVKAEIYFCSMHADFLSPNAAALCDRCGMSLVRRTIPYSFIYVTAGESTLQLAVRTDAPLAVGREARVIVRLSHRDGSPVYLSDLQVRHTQPIHLLIVDPALEDYHHEHPVPSHQSGEYAFSFTPVKNSSYRVFADIVPFATGAQEYPFADLPTTPALGPLPQGESTLYSEADGLRFRLTFEQTDGSPPKAGQVRNLQITISEADGQPTTRLEPVMNAFAHLVGFCDDGRTVLHLHPEGSEITDPTQRGGPSLSFRFYAPKAGFVRLFCQVQVGGKAIFAPFNVNVIP